MTKAELVEKVMASMGEQATKKQAEKAVEAVFESLKAEFIAGHDVLVNKFGSFKVKTRAAREARNPKTGETIHVAEQKTVTFKPVAKMKEEMNTK